MTRPAIIALLFAAAAFADSTAGRAARYPGPDDLAISTDGSRLYVVCGGTDELAVVDRVRKVVIARVPVGRLPRGIAVSPDGSRIYVANSWSDTISEIDSAALRVVRTLPAGFEPTGVAVDSRGEFLYAANRLGGDVSVIDLHAASDVRRLLAGRGASWMAAAGDRVYVTHIYPNAGKFRTQPESEITAIDTVSRNVLSRLPLHNVGGEFHVALSRDGRLGIAAQMRPKNLIPLAHVEHGWAFGNSLALFGEEIGGVVQLPLDAIEDYFSLPFGVAIAPDQSRLTCRRRARTKSLFSICTNWSPPPNRRTPLDWRTICPPPRATSWRAFRWAVTRVASCSRPTAGRYMLPNRLDDSISVLDTARGIVTGYRFRSADRRN